MAFLQRTSFVTFCKVFKTRPRFILKANQKSMIAKIATLGELSKKWYIPWLMIIEVGPGWEFGVLKLLPKYMNYIRILEIAYSITSVWVNRLSLKNELQVFVVYWKDEARIADSVFRVTYYI